MKKEPLAALLVFLLAIALSAGAQPSPVSYSIPVNAYIGQLFELEVPISSFNAYLDPTVGADWDFGYVSVRTNVNNWTLTINSLRMGQLYLPGIEPLPVEESKSVEISPITRIPQNTFPMLLF